MDTTHLLLTKAEGLVNAFEQTFLQNLWISQFGGYATCRAWSTAVHAQIRNGKINEVDFKRFATRLIELMATATLQRPLSGDLQRPFRVISISMEYLLSLVNQDFLKREHTLDWHNYQNLLELTQAHIEYQILTQEDIKMLADTANKLKKHL